MATKTWLFGLALGALYTLAPQSAMAQVRYMGRADNPVGPTVSPYLNLITSGQFGVTNYQSLVRPLIDQGSAIDRQGSQLRGVQQQLSQGAGAGAGAAGVRGPSTGRGSYFMYYSHFYPSAR